MFDPWPHLASGRYDALIAAASAVGDAVGPGDVARLHGMGPAEVALGATERMTKRRPVQTFCA